nr:hypothetical protein [uncultured Rhodopila sp.]
MNVTVRIPDDFARRLGSGDLGRKALEALALQEYRAGRLTVSGLSDVLGYTTQDDLDGFLIANGITAPLADDQPDRDLATRFRAFRAGKTRGPTD